MYGQLARWGISIPVAVIVTIGVIWVMQFLIAIADKGFEDSATLRWVDFVDPQAEQDFEREVPKPKQPPKPEEPPPTPPKPQMDRMDPNASAINIASVNPTTNIAMDGIGMAGIGVSDGDYLPIVKVEPQYPRRAAERGIEGYVILEFTVTRQGTVRDIVVVEEEPRGYFAREAIAAHEKSKYKPKVINGTPIEVPGVRYKIIFELEDGGR